MQSLFTKKDPQYFVEGEETLCITFISFPTSKSSFLTFVVQIMTFQAKLPSHCLESHTVWF